MRSNSWGRRLRRAGLVLVLGASLASAVSDAASATPPTWSAQTAIDPERGGITSISCPTTTFCMAVGITGRAAIYNGHWLRPVQVESVPPNGHGFTSVSCTGPTFCLAVDADGHAARYDGTHWSVRPVLSGFLYQVSCPAAFDCIAVSARSAAHLLGSTWTTHTLTSTASVHAVSCASRTFCVAVGYDSTRGGVAFRFTGSAWTGAVVDAPQDNVGLTAVDCPSPRYCVAGGTNGLASTFNGARWSSRGPDYLGFDASSISCPSTARCLVVGSAGGGAAAARIWTASGWAPARRVDGTNQLGTVSCATTSWCLAGDRGGQVLRSSFAAWSRPVYVDPYYGVIDSVSCADASFCFATDENGDALHWDGVRWSYPVRIDSHIYIASTYVSCASRSFCLMADNRGNTRRFDGTAWQPGPASPGISSLSCVSSRFCVAGTGEGDATIYTGSAWTHPTAAVRSGPGSGGVTTVSCASRTFCAAGTSDSHIVNRFDGVRWGTTGRLAGTGDLVGPSCPSSTACFAVFADGRTFRWTGPAWVHLAATLDTIADALSCAGPTFCVATGSQDASVFDGSHWTSQSIPALPDGYPLFALDCVDPSFCLAGGGAYVTMRR